MMFGGWAPMDVTGTPPSGTLDELWEWDGQRWTRISTPIAPPARLNGAMVYDAARDELVLFGGSASYLTQVELNDTWTWNGTPAVTVDGVQSDRSTGGPGVYSTVRLMAEAPPQLPSASWPRTQSW